MRIIAYNRFRNKIECVIAERKRQHNFSILAKHTIKII